MGRPGRKRKAGRRHPGGELVRDKQPDDRIRMSRQPHRRGLAPELRGAEQAESPLGRLALRGVIDEDQLIACEHYAVLVGQYRSTIEAPRTTGGSGRGVECEPLLCRAYPENCSCAKRRDRYMRAYEALAEVGRAALMAVNRVAVQHEELAPSQLVYLEQGSDALARHFGLTGRRRREHSGNAH